MKNKTEVQLNKVITHNWTILCSNTSIDETSHNISLFNIIETLGLELSIDEVQEKEKDQKGWYSVPFNFWLVTKLQKPNIDLDLMFELKYKVIDLTDQLNISLLTQFFLQITRTKISTKTTTYYNDLGFGHYFCHMASKASLNLRTPITSIPCTGFLGILPIGTIARLKPCFAAS